MYPCIVYSFSKDEFQLTLEEGLGSTSFILFHAYKNQKIS